MLKEKEEIVFLESNSRHLFLLQDRNQGTVCADLLGINSNSQVGGNLAV